MPDENPNSETQTPNDPDPTPSHETTPPAPSDDEPKMYPADYVQNLRTYEKQYKAQIADLKKQVKAFEKSQADQAQADADAEKAQLAEQEKWRELAEKSQAEAKDFQGKLNQMQAQMVETQRRMATQSVAQALGAVNAQDLNFIQATSDIDMSADDADAQIRATLEAMKETHSYLFAQKETPPPPRQQALSGFNPSSGEVKITDAQRIAELHRLTGQGQWGMFGSQKNRSD